MNLRNAAIALCAVAIPFVTSPAIASMPVQHHAVSAPLLQKTSAKRFKRGVRRTEKKVRHFIRRAAGKH